MTRRAYAILIGCTQEVASDPPIAEVKDAIDTMDAFLTERYSWKTGSIADHRERLLGPSATRDRVDKAFAKFTNVLASGDLFVVAFSGHGIPDDDAHPSQGWRLYNGDQLEDYDLAHYLLAFPKNVETVVVSDACYGEGMFNLGPQRRKRLGKATYFKLLAEQGARFFDRLTRSYERARAKTADMICIAAAAPDDYVLDESALVHRLVEVCQADEVTWNEVKTQVEAGGFAQEKFHVDFRPASYGKRKAFSS